jgi:ABC-type multidrug transport system ATPase subunit/ABC-type multidrug transport system permease subunit
MTAIDLTTDLVTRVPERHGFAVEARSLGYVLRDGRRVLDDVTLSVRPGELVAIVGGSGAGKSTLLAALAGVRPATEGTVTYDGLDAAQHRDEFRSCVGFVPQDDIIHRDLPLRATLRYAAQLRLPAGTTATEVDAIVDATISELGLGERAGVRVGHLSGGQRKRASIGVELLTRPLAFFLDEPTSGLDPATARGLMRTLRGLADRGTTVIVTTHNTEDLDACDRVVFLTNGGHLAFAGTVDAACRHFEVDDVTSVYERLVDDHDPGRRARRFARRHVRSAGVTRPRVPRPRRWKGGFRQWQVLVRRNVDVMRSNRLTLAVMFGSPALVIAMFAVLFGSGTFAPGAADTNGPQMVAFWTAFAGFFFGLTFGLLQICTEMAVLRRERFVGMRVGSYLLAKLAVLVPVLAAVVVAMVAVLAALDRLPAMGATTFTTLTVTLVLDALAATALGLLASAAVADPAQATLALPMLCFPAVLFSGAVVPIDLMAAAGRAISVATPNRWAFEAVGQALDLDEVSTGDVTARWIALVAFTAVFLAAAHRVLARRT